MIRAARGADTNLPVSFGLLDCFLDEVRGVVFEFLVQVMKLEQLLI